MRCGPTLSGVPQRRGFLTVAAFNRWHGGARRAKEGRARRTRPAGFVEHCTPRHRRSVPDGSADRFRVCRQRSSLVGLRRWVSGPTVPLLIDRHDRHLMVRRVPFQRARFSCSRKAETNAPSPYCSARPQPREAEVLFSSPMADHARTAAVLALVRAPWTSMSNTLQQVGRRESSQPHEPRASAREGVSCKGRRPPTEMCVRGSPHDLRRPPIDT